jgi:uncharacterized protein (TIGR00290 family)
MVQKVMVSWSGGKDSALALQKVMDDPNYEVSGIFSTTSEESGRLPVHEVKVWLLQKQANALDLPLTIIPIPSHASNKVYEQCLGDFFQQCLEKGVDMVVFADLFLEDIKVYRDQLLNQFQMRGHYPLWGSTSRLVGNMFIAEGFQAVVTTIDQNELGEEWVGKVYDCSFLKELPESVDPCGENGEFHTFVYNGPIFKWPLSLKQGGRFSTLDERFIHVELEEK